MLLCSYFDEERPEQIVSISLGVPPGMEIAGKWSNVMPTPSLLRRWKSGAITWDEYREDYLDTLRARWPRGLNDEMAALRDDLTLCCWEHEPQHCHRSILADVIQKCRPDLTVQLR